MIEFIQYTPKGYKVTTFNRKATFEELLETEAYIDSTFDEEYYDESDNDQDSDGYGWERAALNRIG